MKSTGMVTTRCQLAALLVQAVGEEDNDAREDETTLSSEDHLHARRSRFSRVASYLQTLSASAVDVELNTLCMGDFDDEGKTLLGLFLQFLEGEVATRRHFQVLQAYLNRFLKLYEQLVVANGDLLVRVESLCAVQHRQWDHLQQLLHNNLCLV
jgi:U3 small nucleolar RNA-associated protein 21